MEINRQYNIGDLCFWDMEGFPLTRTIPDGWCLPFVVWETEASLYNTNLEPKSTTYWDNELWAKTTESWL